MAVARRSGPPERGTVNFRAQDSISLHNTLVSSAHGDGLYCIYSQIACVSRHDSIARGTMAKPFTSRGSSFYAQQQISVLEPEVETNGRPPMHHPSPGRPHRGSSSQTILSASRWPIICMVLDPLPNPQHPFSGSVIRPKLSQNQFNGEMTPHHKEHS